MSRTTTNESGGKKRKKLHVDENKTCEMSYDLLHEQRKQTRQIIESKK